MRILLNGLFLVPNRVGGSENYLRGLVQGLMEVDPENEYVLCLGPEAASTFTLPGARWRLLVSPSASRRRAVRIALEQVWLPRVARRLRADIIHSGGYTSPLVSDQARVTTVYDMNYKRHPEDLSLAERAVYSTLIPLVARRSHRVLTLTQAARADILRWTGTRPDRVEVAHLGARRTWPGDPAEDDERLHAAGVAEPFVVSVAASYPHKNLHRLVRTFPLDDGDAVRLVIVGLKGRAHPAVEEVRAQHPELIKVLGWVDDALLASLYRRALALAFPSLYEGFGLPILEAMALGTPVVTSNYGAMAEVAGDAAELVDPYDIQAIRAGLQRVTEDSGRREDLRRRGFERAAEFSWENCARQTLGVYSEALTVSKLRG